MKKDEFLSQMPKEFFYAQGIMIEYIKMDPKPEFHDFLKAGPKELKGYFIQHDIARRIFLSIFEENYFSEQSIILFLNTTLLYLRDYQEFLSLSENETISIKNYAKSALQNEDNDGIYYAIMVLSLSCFVRSSREKREQIFNEVLSLLFNYFCNKKEYDNLRKILNLLIKLPWYSQQFRVIKSFEVLGFQNAMLQLETLVSNQKTHQTNEQVNLFNVWKSLTVDIEIISNRIRPYPQEHIFYEWQFLIQSLIYFEKLQREFSELDKKVVEEYFKYILSLSRSDPGLKDRIGKARLNTLLNKLESSDKMLSAFYKEELEAFQAFYQETEKDRSWYYQMIPSPIFPSDFPFQEPPQDFSPDLKSLVKSIFPGFKENLKNVLKKNQVISLTSVAKNYESIDPNKSNPFILLSTIIYCNGSKIVFSNKKTEITEEDLQHLLETVTQISSIVPEKIILHFQSIYEEALKAKKKHLVWLGSESLKFFPIHILRTEQNTPETWLDTWETIEFSNSLCEYFLPETKQFVPTEQYPMKPKAPFLRLFGENPESPDNPFLGRKIFEQLKEIENSPVMEGNSKFLADDNLQDIPEMKLDFMPEVVSYYGHIFSENYLRQETGFITKNKMSNLNHIISSPELGGTKRVELWGCGSAKLFSFGSKEIPKYEFFAERFFKIGIQQAIATLIEIPDLTASLVWEHFSLSEKNYPEKTISLLLKNSINWYKKSISIVKQRTQKSFIDWLKENKNLSFQELDKKQHPFLRKNITNFLNEIRKDFRSSLSQNFIYKSFTEKDIDKSLLREGKACHLGRVEDKNTQEDARKDSPLRYTTELISRIFSDIESSAAWGSIIFINSSQQILE